MFNLIEQIIYNNLFKNIVLILNIVLVFCIALFSLHYYQEKTRMERIVQSSAFSQCLYVQRDSSEDFLSALDEDERIHEIEETPCAFMFSELLDKDIFCMEQEVGILSRIRPQLYKGKMPGKDGTNQIVISYEMSSIVPLGESVMLTFPEEDGDTYVLKQAKVEVVGILAPNDVFPSPFSSVVSESETDYGDVFDTVGNLEEYSYIVISNRIVSEDGVEATPSSQFANLFFEVENGYSPDDVKRDFVEKYPGVSGNMYTSHDLKVNNDRHVADQKALMYVLLGASMLLMTILFFADLYLLLKKRETEIAEYYICGMTWKQAVLTYFLSFLPAILIALVLGTVSFYFTDYVKMVTGMTYTFSAGVLCIALAMVAMVILISFLPFYYEVIRKSPIQCIREE